MKKTFELDKTLYAGRVILPTRMKASYTIDKEGQEHFKTVVDKEFLRSIIFTMKEGKVFDLKYTTPSYPVIDLADFNEIKFGYPAIIDPVCLENIISAYFVHDSSDISDLYRVLTSPTMIDMLCYLRKVDPLEIAEQIDYFHENKKLGYKPPIKEMCLTKKLIVPRFR